MTELESPLKTSFVLSIDIDCHISAEPPYATNVRLPQPVNASAPITSMLTGIETDLRF